MQRSLWPHGYASLDQLLPSDARALLATAKTLQAEGPDSAALHDQHVAVLSDVPHSASSRAFAAASLALGASVVRIRPSELRLASEGERADTSRMLGRLYSAVACDGVAAETLAPMLLRLQVPVFSALASNLHPTRLLADLLALSAHAHKPHADLTLGLAVPVGSPLDDAWRRMPRLTGISLLPWPLSMGARGVDFFCDASLVGDHEVPLPWAVDDGSVVVPNDLSVRQHQSHHWLVQALLLAVLR